MSKTIEQQEAVEAPEPRALIQAVEQGNEDEVKRLIDAGIPVDETDSGGKNALVEAVSRCNETLVHLLVEEGKALVNARDVYGRTPLFYAITKSKKIAQYLIKKGAAVNLKDFSNRSALSFFVEDCMMNNDIPLSTLIAAKQDEFQMLTDPRKDVTLDIQTILSIVLCKLPLMCAYPTDSTMWTKPSTYTTRTKATIEKTWKNFFPALTEASKHFAEKDTKKNTILQDILRKFEENKPFSAICHDTIEMLVQVGADPNFADADGNTALHFAACLPWMGVSQDTTKHICTQLLELGVPVNAKNHRGQTPLLFCLSSGRMGHLEEEEKVTAMKTLVEVCKFLVTRGSSLEETTQDGESVFHLVIKLFQQALDIPDQTDRKKVIDETMDILDLFSCDRLNEGTTVNKRDCRLYSPLHNWATLVLPKDVDYDNVFGVTLKKILEHLLKVGATLNPKNEDEETPLHLCKTWKAVELLVDFGANPNDVNSSGRSPLFRAAKNKEFVSKPGQFYPDVLEDPEAFWKSAIEKGLDPRATDEQAFFLAKPLSTTDKDHKTTLLYEKSEENGNTTVSIADMHKTDEVGRSALVSAIYKGDKSKFKTLIHSGADIHATDKDGRTALIHAVREGDKEMVDILLKRGSDINAADKNGESAFFYAVWQENEELVQTLLDSSALKINATDSNGKTALFYAIKQENEKFVKTFIDCGADVNRTDNEGKTALFYAVRKWNNERMVYALVDCGADVNSTDNEGKTALFYAVQEKGNESMVRALVDCGADVNRTDKEGKTAFSYAVQQSHNESMVDLLNFAGADLNARDNYGRTPLFYEITGSNVLTTYLLDRGAKLYLEENFSVLTFLFEKSLYEIPFKIPYGIEILIKKSKASKKQILKTIFSVVFNKIISLNPISVVFVRDHLRELLMVAKGYTPVFDVSQRKAIERISERIRGQKLGALSQPETIRTILRGLGKLGANPNTVDSDGNTALHHATQLSWRGVPEEDVLYICNQLKEMGASCHLKNHNDETPLVQCLVTTNNKISSGSFQQWSEVKTQLSLCQFLIKHGSDVEEKTQSGQSALHLILELLQQVLLHKELRNRSLDDLIRLLGEMVRAYKEKEVSKDNNGNTPLHVWAKLALPPGEDYSRIIAEGYAFQGLLSRILNHFKESKVNDLDDKNNDGETPLHVCRTWTAVELLLDARADPKGVDSSGRSLLIAAAGKIKFSPLPNPEHFYPDFLQEPKAFWKKAVVEKCLDPWTVDNQGESVMSILIEAKSFDLAKGLIDFACEDSNPDSAKNVFSLLCAVCKDKSSVAQPKTDLVQIILESGKCQVTGKKEDSPLHFCCRNIVRKPNDVDGVHWKIAEKLLLHEANCNILDSSGESCLDIAQGCQNLKELLLKPIDINKVPLKIKTWRSISTVHKKKLAYVARGRQSTYVNSYWYHKEDLAHGSFGAVFAGISEKDGREVAIKRIEKIRMNRPQDKREIKNLTSLADCEQVVRYLVFFEDDNFSYIVLELMEGHLDQFVDPANPMDTKVLLCQDVVKGLKYLHDHSILHRDLKPTNILYKTHPKLCLKIADFGLSRRIGITDYSTSVYGSNAGTRCWIAPEVLTSTKYQHSTASDMFSCGLVLHYILSAKKHPFSPEDCAKSEFQIRNETERNMIDGNKEGWDDSLFPEATHLLKAMLDRDEKKRPSAGEALDHPFFWTKEKKHDFLIAVGNQPEFECPRAKRTPPLTAVETDLETSFGTIVKYADWNDPGYAHMPAIYTEMRKRRRYDTHSVVELMRFIRNAIASLSESIRPTPFRKQILEDFVFLDYFPNLVMEVYKAVTTHGWDQTREEIKFRHEEIRRVCKKR